MYFPAFVSVTNMQDVQGGNSLITLSHTLEGLETSSTLRFSFYQTPSGFA